MTDLDSATRIVALEGALREAVLAARLFNRGGMAWAEYDALLARLERTADQ